MASSIGIGHSNYLDSATLSALGAAWAPALINVQGFNGRALNMVARSATAAAANTGFDADLGAAKPVQVLCIPAHNLTAAATIRLQGGTTLGGAGVYDSGSLPVWAFTPLDGYPGYHFGAWVVLPAPLSARYWRVSIVDEDNPDDYVQISRPFIGPMFVPAITPVKLTGGWMPSFSTVERTEIGADLVANRPPLRAPAIVFGALTFDEGNLLSEIQRTHNTAVEVLFVAHRWDRARLQQHGCMALMRELSELEYPRWKHNGIALGFQQRGGAPLT